MQNLIGNVNGNVTINIYSTPGAPIQGQMAPHREAGTEFAQEFAPEAKPLPERLVDEIRGKRQPWRPKKKKTIKLSKAMHELGQSKKANRVWWCSEELVFTECPETGKKKLRMANFCRERLCVMCNWRLSIKTFYQLSQVMDIAQEENPNLVPIFLTLTVTNCSGDDLPATLDMMFSGWARLTEHRRVRKAIKGWFRALEVTYNKEKDDYHPHFHALMVVDKSYFSTRGVYLHHEKENNEWAHIWRTSCRLDYDPVTDIRAVRNQHEGRNRKHVAEVAKYTVKDTDYIHEDEDLTVKIVNALGKALYRRRLFAYGGVLKEIAKRIKADREAEDLIHMDETSTMREDIANQLIIYKWDFGLADYFRTDTFNY